jgi:hypothetical protein
MANARYSTMAAYIAGESHRFPVGTAMTVAEMLEAVDHEEYSLQVLVDRESEQARRLGVLTASIRALIASCNSRRICCPLVESSVAAGSFIYIYGDHEGLDEAERRRRAYLRASSALLEQLRSLDARQFEELCGVILRLIGCRNVTVTRSQGDDGVDAVAELPLVAEGVEVQSMTPAQRLVHGLSFLVYFQAKRYAADHSVEKEEVHALIGSWDATKKQFSDGTLAAENTQALKKADYRSADPVLLVLGTSSQFTLGAKTRGEDAGVVLLDGEQMVQLLLDLELGVEVDENFESKIILHDVSWDSYNVVAPRAAVSGGFLDLGIA